MVKITSVIRGSPADKSGIQPGDYLCAVNGHKITDVLDYEFYAAEFTAELELSREDSSVYKKIIRKPRYASLGLEFESFIMDEQKRCRNACIFCFIDQLPKGILRDTLYFKDDDERLSFLHGNYITLTNLDDEHIERIIKMHISPINVSVHTTNPELRVKMMRNKRAGETLVYLKTLSDAGITLNAQIVLCKGYNDGAELIRTLTDLSALENIDSIAVVPFGATRFREENGLAKIEPFTSDEVSAMINSNALRELEALNLERYGDQRIHFADEFFVNTDIHAHVGTARDDYPQLENGVGMIRKFVNEFVDTVDYLNPVSREPKRYAVVTGTAMERDMRYLCKYICERCKGLAIDIIAVKNKFFGETVTVAGLLTGADVAEALADVQADEALIPSSMLRSEGDLFLDGMSIEELRERTKISIKIIDPDGEELARTLLS
ncbi:Fe-S oxidoreductase [Clostridia bacterium]|nr:Fe-S oxidoreductase [Clostridia bacterium]